MTSLDKIIDIAQKSALEEIQKFDSPNITQFEIANEMGQKIANNLKADTQIVILGTILMDYKIGEAISQNRLKEHIKMSRDAAEELLKANNLPEDQINKVLNCIEGHHKTAQWKYPEAEICANADCYRFLTYRGIISFLVQTGKRGMGLDESIKYALSKVEEKWGILSLPICKQELEPNYIILKKLLEG